MKKQIIAFLLIAFTSFVYPQFGTQTGNTNMSDMAALNMISVTIGGDFIVTGSFPALATQRVDEFVTSLYTQYRATALSAARDNKTFFQIENKTGDFAKRNIKIKRFDGTEITIDLMKFRLTGDFEQNPYLRNGDVIIFPVLDLERNFITISGAVNKEVKCQFVDGDKLSDVLMFAQGINKAYENVTKAEISRLSYDGNKVEKIVFEIADNPELKRGDRIRILADETNRKDYKVLVLGEVNSPGYVYITKETTTVKEVLNEAGGLLPNATLTDAALLRDYTSFQTLQNYVIKSKSEQNPVLSDPKILEQLYNSVIEQMRMYRMSNLTEEDTAFFNVDNKLRILDNDTYLDFTKVFKDSSDESKFIANDGDVIIIPKKNEYVYVFGQIRKPGYIKYKPGADYKYYLSVGGGLGDYAQDEDNIAVIKGKTRNWIYADEPDLSIEPGDYIYIPKDPPRTFSFYLTRTSQIAGIIGSVATVILLLSQLGK